MVEEKTRKELIKQKSEILHKICELEFKEKGFKEKLKQLKIPYKLFYRTPLGKLNQYQETIGIPKKQFDDLMKNKLLIIIGISNPIEVDTHNYYVFNSLFQTGKGGSSSFDEYIDIKRKDPTNNRWKILLQNMKEFLNEKEK